MARASKFVLLSLAAILLAATPASAQDWEALRSTFLTNNPNGEWTCGFLNADNEFVPFNTTFDDGAGVTGWCLNMCPGLHGDVTVNFGEKPIDRYGIRWESGQMCVNPGTSGLGTVIRWTAPADASIRIGANMTGQTISGGGAVFTVVHNETSKFDHPVDGFAGKGEELLERNGSDPEASCLLSATVKSGDTVDFIVTKKDDVTFNLIGFDAVVEITSAEDIRLSSASPVPMSPQTITKLLPGKATGEKIALLDESRSLDEEAQ